VALAEAGERGELRERDKIANTPAALRTYAAKLASHGWRLRFCYEAGPSRFPFRGDAEKAALIANLCASQQRPASSIQ
jgi:transposase